MQHESDIKQILYCYNYDFSNIDFKTNLENVIDQIQTDLIQKSISLEDSRTIMGKIWKFRKSKKIENLKIGSLKDILNQVKQLEYYSVKKDFIVYKNFIPCSAIKYSNEFHILNQNQIKKLMNLGYGINSFKLEIDDRIKELYCDGKHPNLNPSYKIFCLDDTIRNSELTVENLGLIEVMLTQFNLDSNYMKMNEFNSIMEIIK